MPRVRPAFSHSSNPPALVDTIGPQCPRVRRPSSSRACTVCRPERVFSAGDPYLRSRSPTVPRPRSRAVRGASPGQPQLGVVRLQRDLARANALLELVELRLLAEVFNAIALRLVHERDKLRVA